MRRRVRVGYIIDTMFRVLIKRAYIKAPIDWRVKEVQSNPIWTEDQSQNILKNNIK